MSRRCLWWSFGVLASWHGSYCTPFLVQRQPGDAIVLSTFSDGTHHDFVKEENWDRTQFSCPEGGLWMVYTSHAVCSRHGLVVAGERGEKSSFLGPPPHGGRIPLLDGVCFLGEAWLVVVRRDRVVVASPHLLWFRGQDGPVDPAGRIVRDGEHARIVFGSGAKAGQDPQSSLDVTGHPCLDELVQVLEPRLH